MPPTALRGCRVSKLFWLKASHSLPHFYQYIISCNRPTTPLLVMLRLSSSFSSIGGRGGGSRPPPPPPPPPLSGGEEVSSSSNDHRFDGNTNDRQHNNGRQNPPFPIPNRPLRGERPIYQSERSKFDSGRPGKSIDKNTPFRVGGNRTASQSQSSSSGRAESVGDDFLDKFKLGFDKEGEKPLPDATKPQFRQEEDEENTSDRAVPVPPPPPLTPPQDADEIFKKMKETGLIPNAVAMLDGLCKDGLVQEAMKLFGLMREKGTIPEVVIYTAVVEGFCKAQKFEDAQRIFRKMQNNGISPNAFSYTVLIQGLYKGKRLEDALDFCVEMLEAGHSPNVATFVGLVDGFCREKGLEEAQSTIGTLKQKGFFFDDKAVRDHLEKKGPFLPLVWEAIFGKKIPQRFF
ncbi:pentatricopeptide repeat-containing protein At4g38150 [Cornus florida]|uniref:pentatricopeptide repeat-containing protein At4g38150 n=1 Tax=Cornus florida TaxID=4283 RepID=UPI00289A3AB4|nr:pentatricopeptide repeat-containing protein At4g38150 [Cornus florida]XP_059654100.1 pentatricopeptide repeat-containing protein At4g38150 [Cornus florida]